MAPRFRFYGRLDRDDELELGAELELPDLSAELDELRRRVPNDPAVLAEELARGVFRFLGARKLLAGSTRSRPVPPGSSEKGDKDAPAGSGAGSGPPSYPEGPMAGNTSSRAKLGAAVRTAPASGVPRLDEGE